MTWNDSTWIYLYPQTTFDKTINKIESFRLLESGWRFGDGVTPSAEVIKSAILLVERSIKLGLNKTDAIPQVDGGIQVVISNRNRSLEFHIEPNCTITYYKLVNNADVDNEDGLNIETAFRKLWQYWNEECGQLGLLSLENTSQMTPDSEVQDSNHQAMDREFLSLTGTV